MIDKSVIKWNEDTGEISGIDETIKLFVEKHPELVKAETTTSVDTSSGSRNSGEMSDEDLVALKSTDILRLKKDNPALYKRWSSLATHNQTPVIPEHKKKE